MSSRERARDRLGGLWRSGCFGVPGFGGRLMVFVRVNQVLVRLWARAVACPGSSPGVKSDRMSGSVREHGLGSRDRLGSEARLCVLSEMIHDGIVLGGFPGMVPVHGVGLPFRGRSVALEHEKGIRWMPWHQEAMKDVARCEKPWGAASRR